MVLVLAQAQVLVPSLPGRHALGHAERLAPQLLYGFALERLERLGARRVESCRIQLELALSKEGEARVQLGRQLVRVVPVDSVGVGRAGFVRR